MNSTGVPEETATREQHARPALPERSRGEHLYFLPQAWRLFVPRHLPGSPFDGERPGSRHATSPKEGRMTSPKVGTLRIASTSTMRLGVPVRPPLPRWSLQAFSRTKAWCESRRGKKYRFGTGISTAAFHLRRSTKFQQKGPKRIPCFFGICFGISPLYTRSKEGTRSKGHRY